MNLSRKILGGMGWYTGSLCLLQAKGHISLGLMWTDDAPGLSPASLMSMDAYINIKGYDPGEFSQEFP